MDKGTLPMREEERITFLSILHQKNKKKNKKDGKGGGAEKEEYNLFKNERHLESLKKYGESLEQTIRFLNVMKSLLNSRVFMYEMAKQDMILQQLTLMLMSKSPVISLLAAQVLRATCHHFTNNEHKIERMNKRALIRGPRPNWDESYSNQHDYRNS